MVEKKDPSEDQKPKGEFLFVSQEQALDPDFFKALMEFQYGGDQVTSDEGFEKMKELVSTTEKQNTQKS